MRVELSVAAIAALISYLRSETDVNAVRGHSRPNLMPSFPTNYFLLILHYLFGCFPYILGYKFVLSFYIKNFSSCLDSPVNRRFVNNTTKT